MNLDRTLINKSIQALGFESLNAMQEEILKTGLNHHHLVVYAPTGSGKTLGFLLLCLHFLKRSTQEVQAAIIVPSRELALQIEEVFRNIKSGFKINSCYGGHSIKTEINNFQEPPAILIGTPGRIADHLKRESFITDKVSVLVLDEFDKSLELGFEQEMQYILSKLTHLKRKILTSATLMNEIPPFTQIKNPKILNFIKEEIQPNFSLKAIRSREKDKLSALKELIDSIDHESTLIFCNHRDAVDRISGLLDQENTAHDIFHGGLNQEERERALIKFRNGSLHFLITTDLASRGLDISDVKHIIHYQLPTQKNAFIHRNGRTARMQKEGTIWLILSETETLPDYMDEEPEFIVITEKNNLQRHPEWTTFYFGGGKKDKITKTDIVGFLIQQGGLKKEDIGLITVQDFSSYAAVKREKTKQTLHQIKGSKIKGKKLKIAISD
jgi:ATP-independent RNA helicase DbpA